MLDDPVFRFDDFVCRILGASMNENVLVSETARRSGSWLHYYANPGRFLRLAKPALPWLAAFSIAVTAIGVIWGYAFAPADWEQGNAARIMYVHVPAAWVAMAGYAALAVCSFFSIIWRHPCWMPTFLSSVISIPISVQYGKNQTVLRSRTR